MARKALDYFTDKSVLKDKLTIRNTVLELHEEASWFNNYFKKSGH